jgi:hypothetical protein
MKAARRRLADPIRIRPQPFTRNVGCGRAKPKYSPQISPSPGLSIGTESCSSVGAEYYTPIPLATGSIFHTEKHVGFPLDWQ